MITSVKMLQKLQEYKWYIIIVLTTCIGLYLIYQSFATNRKINMLYRCLNELSLKIEDVSSNQTVKQEQPKLIKQQPVQQSRKAMYRESPRKKSEHILSNNKQVDQRDVLPPISPNNKPTITETLIFQVSPQPVPTRHQNVTSSTIEEIDTDSDSDVDVKSLKIKPTDLDKELEAELEELDS